MLFNDVLGELGYLAVGDDRPLLHHIKRIRQAPSEFQILFDQQNRDLALRLDPRDDLFDLLNDRGLNPFGWLVEEQDLAQSPSPCDRQLLLLPAAEEPTFAVEQARQRRKELKHGVWDLALAALLGQ